jgi:hypothetical protein
MDSERRSCRFLWFALTGYARWTAEIIHRSLWSGQTEESRSGFSIGSDNLVIQ